MSADREDAEQMMLKSLAALYRHLVAECVHHSVCQPDANLGAFCLVHHKVAPQIIHQLLPKCHL